MLEPIPELKAFFNAPPTAQQHARIYLMRQACHMFFAAILLCMARAGRPGLPLSPQALDTPPLSQVRAQTGTLLATPEGQCQLSVATCKELLGNLRADRFAHAVRIVQGD